VLFTCTQRRLLGFVYGQPERDYRFSELVALTGSGDGATKRELVRLVDAGLVARYQVGARTCYRAAAESPVHRDLKNLVQNSFGLFEPLRDAFLALRPQIALLFSHEAVMPSPFPNPAIELMMVVRQREPAAEALEHAIRRAEDRLARGVILPRILRAESLRELDEYEAKVFARPRFWVFGSERRLEAMTSGP
jgi:hypothetical protein